MKLRVLLLAVGAALGAASVPPAQVTPPSAGVAYRVVNIQSGDVLGEARADVLARRGRPGSIVKIATLVAALESGTIDAATRLECPGAAVADGRRVTCAHPALHRPLTPVDALAHSCNSYFAAIARRLPRGAFDRALVSLGLRPSDPSVPLPVAALGLGGVDATPAEWLEALTRLTVPTPLPGLRPDHLEVVWRGLRRAASEGTASSLGASGLDALVKTGTAPAAGGGYLGLVVAVTPAARPVRGVVVVTAGNAGSDAAAIAADLLRTHVPRVGLDAGSVALPAAVRVGRLRAGRYEVESIAIEDYVARVLAAEAGAGGPAAALDAFAVTVRTYAAANRGRHQAEGFDLCDLTHCQVMGAPTEPTRRAAARTAGLLLTYEGRPASVFYTASCGGRSERASAIWARAGDLPYLVGRDDLLCRNQPEWASEVPVETLVTALRAAGFRGDHLDDLHVAARTASGRVATVALRGFVPPEISGDVFRLAVGRSAGWQLLKSTAFDVAPTSRGYRFTGRGAGHGVGLCMSGATRMAELGHTALSILSEYFPGTLIVKAAAGGTRSPSGIGPTRIEIRMPTEEEGERATISALVQRALDETGRVLGAPGPARLRLTFHPSVASYNRATGQPWWTAAASRDTEVHLIPLPSLRDRHILTRIIRHEVVHVLTAAALAGRPAWVREGLAVHLAGEADPAPPGISLPPCPSDRELTQSESSAALEDAYRRAAACVARALASGVRWRDIR